jgi:hypothetical protein
LLKRFTKEQPIGPDGGNVNDRNIPSDEEASCANHPPVWFDNALNHASRKRRRRLGTDRTAFERILGVPDLTPARTFFDPLDARSDIWYWKKLRQYHLNTRRAWDEYSKYTLRDSAIYGRARAILQSCAVPKWAGKIAAKQTVNRNLNGFSRHYQGVDGACIGFALLLLYDAPADAKESYIVDFASSEIPDLDEEDLKGLVDYVFRKYGGES